VVIQVHIASLAETLIENQGWLLQHNCEANTILLQKIACTLFTGIVNRVQQHTNLALLKKAAPQKLWIKM